GGGGGGLWGGGGGAGRCGDPNLVSEVQRSQTFVLSGSPRPAELERVARESLDDQVRGGYTVSLRLFQIGGAAAARGDRAGFDAVLTDEYPRYAQRWPSQWAQQNLLVMRGASA